MILKEDANCWRLSQADKVAFLIDGAAYFETLVAAVKQAKKSLYIAAMPSSRPRNPCTSPHGISTAAPNFCAAPPMRTLLPAWETF